MTSDMYLTDPTAPPEPRTGLGITTASKLSRGGSGSQEVAPHSPRKWKRLLVFGVLALAAGLLVGCASASTSTQIGPVETGGSSLPPFTDSTNDPAIGMVAPTLQGTDFSGNAVTVNPTSDGPRLLAFVAHWCPACQKEVPELVDWSARADALPVTLISTAAAAGRPNWPPQIWLDKEGWVGPVIRDDTKGSAMAAYGMTAFPALVFLDADGRVALRITGAIGVDALEQITRQLKQNR
jgi:thiol-disulfide isomerase/thioredoxin